MREEKNKKNFLISSNDTINLDEHYAPIDFSKIKVGLQTLDDAVINDVSIFKRIDPRLADKDSILRAISKNDLSTMRDISNFFYRVSGIYSRLCKYLAYMYRYD